MAQHAARLRLNSMEEVRAILQQWAPAIDSGSFIQTVNIYQVVGVNEFIQFRIFPIDTSRISNKKQFQVKSQEVTFFQPQDEEILLKIVHQLHDSDEKYSPELEELRERVFNSTFTILLLGKDWSSLNFDELRNFYDQHCRSPMPFHGIVNNLQYWGIDFEEKLLHNQTVCSLSQIAAAQALLHTFLTWLIIQLQNNPFEFALSFDKTSAETILQVAFSVTTVKGDSIYRIVEIFYFLIFSSKKKMKFLRSLAWQAENRHAFYQANVMVLDRSTNTSKKRLSTLEVLLNIIEQRIKVETNCSLVHDVSEIIWTLLNSGDTAANSMKCPPFFNVMRSFFSGTDLPLDVITMMSMFKILEKISYSSASMSTKNVTQDMSFALTIIYQALKKCEDIEFVGSHVGTFIKVIMQLVVKLCLTEGAPPQFLNKLWENSTMLHSILNLLHFYCDDELRFKEVIVACWKELLIPTTKQRPSIADDPLFAEIGFFCWEKGTTQSIVDVTKVMADHSLAVTKSLVQSKHARNWISIIILRMKQHANTQREALLIVKHSYKILASLTTLAQVPQTDHALFVNTSLEMLALYKPQIKIAIESVEIVFRFLHFFLTETNPPLEMEMEKHVVDTSLEYLRILPWRELPVYDSFIVECIWNIIGLLQHYDATSHYPEDPKVYMTLFVDMLQTCHTKPFKPTKTSTTHDKHDVIFRLLQFIDGFIEDDFLTGALTLTQQGIPNVNQLVGSLEYHKWKFLFEISDKLHELLINLLFHYSQSDKELSLDIVVLILVIIMHYLTHYLQADDIDTRFVKHSSYQSALLQVLSKTSDEFDSDTGRYLPTLFAALMQVFYTQGVSETKWNELMTSMHHFVKVVIMISSKNSDYDLLPTIDFLFYCNKKALEMHSQPKLISIFQKCNGFFEVIVKMFRQTKHHAILFERVCQVVHCMNLSAAEVDAFTSINGACDLLIQSLRYHKSQKALVHVVCLILLYCCEQSEPATKKLSNVANCFEILLMTCKEQSLALVGEETLEIVHKLFQRLVASNRNKSKQMGKDFKGMDLLLTTFLQFTRITSDDDEDRTPLSFVTTVCCLLSDLCSDPLNNKFFSTAPSLDCHEVENGGPFVDAAVFVLRHHHQDNPHLIRAITSLVTMVGRIKDNRLITGAFFIKSFDLILQMLSREYLFSSHHQIDMVKATCKMLYEMFQDYSQLIPWLELHNKRCVDILLLRLKDSQLRTDMEIVHAIIVSLLCLLRSVLQSKQSFHQAPWMFEVLNQIEEIHCENGRWNTDGFSKEVYAISELITTFTGDERNVSHLFDFPRLLIAALHNCDYGQEVAAKLVAYLTSRSDLMPFVKFAKASPLLYERLQYLLVDAMENKDEEKIATILFLRDSSLAYKGTTLSQFISVAINNSWQWVEVILNIQDAHEEFSTVEMGANSIFWRCLPYAIISTSNLIQMQIESQPKAETIRSRIQEFILSQIKWNFQSGIEFKLICSSLLASIEICQLGIDEQLLTPIEGFHNWIEFFLPNKAFVVWSEVLIFYCDSNIISTDHSAIYAALVQMLHFLRSVFCHSNKIQLNSRLKKLIQRVAATHIASHVQNQWVFREELVEYGCSLLRILNTEILMSENEDIFVAWKIAISTLEVFGLTGNLNIVEDCCCILLIYLEKAYTSTDVSSRLFDDLILPTRLLNLFMRLLEEHRYDENIVELLLTLFTRFFEIGSITSCDLHDLHHSQLFENYLSFLSQHLSQYQRRMRIDMSECCVDRIQPLIAAICSSFEYGKSNFQVNRIYDIPDRLIDTLLIMLNLQLSSSQWKECEDRESLRLYLHRINQTVIYMFDTLDRCVSVLVTLTKKVALWDTLLITLQHCNKQIYLDRFSGNPSIALDVITNVCRRVFHLADKVCNFTLSNCLELIPATHKHTWFQTLMLTMQSIVFGESESDCTSNACGEYVAPIEVLLLMLVRLSNEDVHLTCNMPLISTKTDTLLLLSKVSNLYSCHTNIDLYVGLLFGRVASCSPSDTDASTLSSVEDCSISQRLRRMANNILGVFQQQRSNEHSSVQLPQSSQQHREPIDIKLVMNLFDLSVKFDQGRDETITTQSLECLVRVLKRFGLFWHVCVDCCQLLVSLLDNMNSDKTSYLINSSELCKCSVEFMIRMYREQYAELDVRDELAGNVLSILQTLLANEIEIIANGVSDTANWLAHAYDLVICVLPNLNQNNDQITLALLKVIHNITSRLLDTVNQIPFPKVKVIGELFKVLQRACDNAKPHSYSVDKALCNEQMVIVTLKVMRIYMVAATTEESPGHWLPNNGLEIFCCLLSNHMENEVIVCNICEMHVSIRMSMQMEDLNGTELLLLSCLLKALKHDQSSALVATWCLRVMACMLQDHATELEKVSDEQMFRPSQALLTLFHVLRKHPLYLEDLISNGLRCIRYLLSSSNVTSEDLSCLEPHRHHLADMRKFYTRQRDGPIDYQVMQDLQTIMIMLGLEQDEGSDLDKTAIGEFMETTTLLQANEMRCLSSAVIASSEIELDIAIDNKIGKGKWRGIPVAIKLHSNDSNTSKELDILSSLRNPRIITVFGSCDSLSIHTDQSLSPGLLLEYMNKGDLRSLLSLGNGFASLTLEKKLQIAVDVSEGMTFLHASQVIHRCLKTSHILLDDHYRAKISGFGEERSLQREKSPNKFLFTSKNRSIDIYDFGVMLWELITGKMPWEDKIAKQAKLTLTAKETKDGPPTLVKLMNHCMESVIPLSLGIPATKTAESISFQDINAALMEFLKEEQKQVEQRKRAIPDGFICPITQDIMKDPVILVADGHSYERKAILEWLQRTNRSPLTNEELPVVNMMTTIAGSPPGSAHSIVVVENYALKSAIQSFLVNQELFQR
jgi:serine/threonine protein kinase